MGRNVTKRRSKPKMKMGGSSTKAVEFGRAKSSNIQAPSTREASNPKLQTRRSAPLGAWFLEFLWSLGVGAWTFGPRALPPKTPRNQIGNGNEDGGGVC